MIPFTVAEIARLLAAQLTRPGHHRLLARLETEPPSPRPLVSPANKTRPRYRNCPGQIANGCCRTRRQSFPLRPAYGPACAGTGLEGRLDVAQRKHGHDKQASAARGVTSVLHRGTGHRVALADKRAELIPRNLDANGHLKDARLIFRRESSQQPVRPERMIKHVDVD